jgi:hypothetical protein
MDRSPHLAPLQGGTSPFFAITTLQEKKMCSAESLNIMISMAPLGFVIDV